MLAPRRCSLLTEMEEKGMQSFVGDFPMLPAMCSTISLLTSRVALKERNQVVPESDSPVKRTGRKVAQVLSCEGEDEDEAPGTPKVQVGSSSLLVSFLNLIFVCMCVYPCCAHGGQRTTLWYSLLNEF